MKKHSKRVVRDPMACITSRMPLDDSQTTDLGIAYRMQLEAMIKGKGTDTAWHTLTAALNTALVMADRGVCTYGLVTINAALDALVRCKARYDVKGVYAFDYGLKDVMRAFAIYDEQLATAPQGVILNAVKAVYKQVEKTT